MSGTILQVHSGSSIWCCFPIFGMWKHIYIQIDIHNIYIYIHNIYIRMYIYIYNNIYNLYNIFKTYVCIIINWKQICIFYIHVYIYYIIYRIRSCELILPWQFKTSPWPCSFKGRLSEGVAIRFLQVPPNSTQCVDILWTPREVCLLNPTKLTIFWFSLTDLWVHTVMAVYQL